jgi:hypothetical protein
VILHFDVVSRLCFPRFLNCFAPPPLLPSCRRQLYLAQELAKRLESEKREREEKAFATGGSSWRRGEPTVPEPFHLSDSQHAGKAAERRSALVAAVQAEELRDCTFHPHTMAGKNKKLIERLLTEEV